MTFRFVLIFWLICLVLSSHALAEKKTITWRISDWAPVYILDGPFKGQGAGDRLIDFFSRRMPEYTHKTVLMTSKRFYHEASQGTNIVNATGLPHKAVYTSIASTVILPHQVIFRKDKIHLLDSIQRISLEQLLCDPRFIAGVSFGRYPDVLNQMIDKYKKSLTIHNFPKYKNIIQMLFAGRIDYTLEYPQVIHYYEQLNQKKGKVVTIPIQEIEATFPFFVSYVVVPRTEWGTQVLKTINEILRKERNTPDYREINLRWYDKRQRPLITKIMDETYND